MRSGFNTLILIILLITLNLSAKTKNEIQKISMHITNKNTFHLAGVYMAKHKGFYKNKNFDLEFKRYEKDSDVLLDVLSGKVNFSLENSSLLIEKSQNKDIYLLAAFFESSAHST